MTVRPVELPPFDQLNALRRVVMLAECAAYASRAGGRRGAATTTRRRWRDWSPASRSRASTMCGRWPPAGRCCERFCAEIFAEADVLALPDLPGDHAGHRRDRHRRRRSLHRCRQPARARWSGRSTIWACRRSACPIGYDARGMPLGLQLVARPFGEGLLLRVAARIRAGRRDRCPAAAAPDASLICCRWPPAGCARPSCGASCSRSLAMLMFGLMDAASKYLSTRYPTPQIIWLRYVFTIPMALVVLAPRGIGRTLRSAPALAAGAAVAVAGDRDRARASGASASCRLADVHSVLALTPLAVTALAVPLLGEQVGPRRWAAVGVGFLGVLIILRPGLGVIAAGVAGGTCGGAALRPLPGAHAAGRPGRRRRDQPALAAGYRRCAGQLRACRSPGGRRCRYIGRCSWSWRRWAASPTTP